MVSDCERIGDGLLAQPVNALSALAYVVAGLAVLAKAGHRRVMLGYGVALIAVGVGSVDFHGPDGFGARWLHDVTIVVVLLLVVAHDTGRPAVIAAALVVAPAAAVWPEIGTAALALLIAAAVIAEVVVYQHRARPLTRATIGTALALTAGAAVFVLTRTDAPLCRPDALVQGHAVWHVLTAVALGMWGLTALRSDEAAGRNQASARSRRRHAAAGEQR